MSLPWCPTLRRRIAAKLMDMNDFSYNNYRHPTNNREAIRAVLACVGIVFGIIIIGKMFGPDGWADWTGKIVLVIVLFRYMVKSQTRGTMTQKGKQFLRSINVPMIIRHPKKQLTS